VLWSEGLCLIQIQVDALHADLKQAGADVGCALVLLCNLGLKVNRGSLCAEHCCPDER
jgi:hypothetical protein